MIFLKQFKESTRTTWIEAKLNLKHGCPKIISPSDGFDDNLKEWEMSNNVKS